MACRPGVSAAIHDGLTRLNDFRIEGLGHALEQIPSVRFAAFAVTVPQSW